MIPMNNLPNPTGNRPKEDERRLDLQTAYRVMIRAYLRQRQVRPVADEVTHG